MTAPTLRRVVAAVAISGLLLVSSTQPSWASKRWGPDKTASGGLTLTVPQGWAQQQTAGTIILAPTLASLRAATPVGPRFTVMTLATVNPATSIAKLERSTYSGSVTSTQLTVAGDSAVAVTWTEKIGRTLETSRLVVVSNPKGPAYTFLLEDLASRWTKDLPILTKILGSVRLG